MRLVKSIRKTMNGRFKLRRHRPLFNGTGSALGNVAGALAGSALMYFLDPRTGSRRRGLVRDKAVRVLHAAEDAAGKTARDLASRSRGVVAETMGRIQPRAAPVDDETLARRVGRQGGWSPGPRLLSGTAGLALTALGLRNLHRISAPLALGAGLAGLALLARSATSKPFRRVLGVGARRPAIELEKEMTVGAPVSEVYAFWRAMENFPRFMTHVKEVRRHPGGRYHWTVSGPANLSFAWDAEITAEDPERLLAWRSIEGTLVPNAGVVRFDAVDGGTRIHVRLSYNPPGGALGHGFAQLLGADPRQQMDEDLVRFKSLMEEGKATGPEGQVTKEEIMADGLGR